MTTTTEATDARDLARSLSGGYLTCHDLRNERIAWAEPFLRDRSREATHAERVALAEAPNVDRHPSAQAARALRETHNRDNCAIVARIHARNRTWFLRQPSATPRITVVEREPDPDVAKLAEVVRPHVMRGRSVGWVLSLILNDLRRQTSNTTYHRSYPIRHSGFRPRHMSLHALLDAANLPRDWVPNDE